MDKVDLRQSVYKSYTSCRRSTMSSLRIPRSDRNCCVVRLDVVDLRQEVYDLYTLCRRSTLSILSYFINPYVDVFTLLDGYQELGTSRREMTECNWQGVLKNYHRICTDLMTPPKKPVASSSAVEV